MKNILVINGPNMNLLGVREPGIYGDQSLEEINARILQETEELPVEVDFFQSNHEGDIIDEIQAAYYNGVDGIVINAGAYTHYSYAIRDAVASVDIPFVEVHLSDTNTREDFRKVSVMRDVCIGLFMGQGYKSYVQAIALLAEQAQGESYD